MTDPWRQRIDVFGDGRAVIYEGDCLEILPTPAAGNVDAVVIDPPFGVEGGAGHDAIDRKRPLVYGTADMDTAKYVQTVCVPTIELCRELVPVVVVTPGVRCLWFYPRPDDMGCFWQPAGARRGPWGFHTFSPILYYGKDWRAGKGSTPTGYMLNEAAPECDHPCPKPRNAWRWLVDKACRRWGRAMDPMMGSGSTGVACVETGRSFIGIEINPDFFTVAHKRILDAAPLFTQARSERQGDAPLFEGREKPY